MKEQINKKTINKIKLLTLILIFSFQSFTVLNAKKITVKCIKVSSDERQKLIKSCKDSCSVDVAPTYGGSLSLDYNIFGGIRPYPRTSIDKCKLRCEAEVDFFIRKHCEGYEIDMDMKDLAQEIIKNMPSKAISGIYDPNMVYQ